MNETKHWKAVLVGVLRHNRPDIPTKTGNSISNETNVIILDSLCIFRSQGSLKNIHHKAHEILKYKKQVRQKSI